MFEGLSNDRSLEDSCPSFARAATVFREQVAKEELARATTSPVESVLTALSEMNRRFGGTLPQEAILPDFVRELAANRPRLVESIAAIALNPDATAGQYRLDDGAFERLWKKTIKVNEALDVAILAVAANASPGEAIAHLHMRLLDATMEIHRAIQRRSESSPVATPTHGEVDGPISEADARSALNDLIERGDDTSWTVRGL